MQFSRGRQLRVDEQLAPQLHQRLVLDRTSRSTPVLILQCWSDGRRGLRPGHVSSADRAEDEQTCQYAVATSKSHQSLLKKIASPNSALPRAAPYHKALRVASRMRPAQARPIASKVS